MKYIEKIEELIKKVDTSLLDITEKRTRGRIPTQVVSDFLTNKEQGDWAEKTLLEGINSISSKYVAVKYGRDDDIIAGEEGFNDFYNNYQEELDTIGKRPDILIFDKKDFNFETLDISNFSIEILNKIVPKAKCGIEVRSSAFLIDKYEFYMQKRNNDFIENAEYIRKIIMSDYAELLKQKKEELYTMLKNEINEENIHNLSFNAPTWKKSQELIDLSIKLKELKSIVSQVNKRTYLSITPKVEDLKVVYNWIKKYNVPHFYVQVFLDKAYGISFEKILKLIGKSELKNKEYFIEKDVKNHNKTTIKIRANKECNIIENIKMPIHHSNMQEIGRGRILYYIKFEKSECIINKDGFKKLFGVDL